MASPVDSARQGTNIATAATSHAINVGSPTAGTLLIVFVRFAAAPGAVTFTGYTQFATDSSDASDDTTTLYYRWADGAEGASDTLATTNSVKLAAVCWKITGAENPATQAPEAGAVRIGVSPNSIGGNAVTPTGGSKDYLFLLAGGADQEAGTAFTLPAFDWSNLIAANSGTGGAAATNVMIAGASRQLTATFSALTSFDTYPAAATGWTAYQIAIHPPSAGAQARPSIASAAPAAS